MMRVKGFTLIELIIVIVLLAIVSTFTFRFVGIGAEMYAIGAERLKQLEQSRFAIERMTREIRNAVPNSVRVTPSQPVNTTFQCLEFVPIKVAGTYYNAPFRKTDEKSLDFVSTADDWDDITTEDRLFIYATLPTWIYRNENRFATVEQNTVRVDEHTPITLNDDSLFAQRSPRQRLYVGNTPVSFCIEGDKLFRYEKYGWLAEQPEPNDFLPLNHKKSQISSNLVNLINAPDSNKTSAFQVERSVLRRSNVIHVFLEYRSRQQERLYYNHDIRIPNAP
ncbi:MAG: pilus assembly protein [Idiomarina sp.]|nr:pilus assembly protein [Idiomarina sp.]